MTKKQIALLGFIVALPVMFFISCTKSSADQQTPPITPPVCDTVQMKYGTDITKILQDYCYSCHGTGNTSGSGGILLQGYDNIQGYAKNGTLMGVITHASGYPAMPYQLPKLDDCTINKVRDWVNQGSPDN